MRIASSARMLVILGASLTAAIAPVNVIAANYGGGAMGIDGSAGLGIDGSSILGIDGSSILGIDGSSALGIDGSSGLGIDGSSGLGIDGSSALGIDGSSILGIDGSSGLGIDGSSALGIDGSSGLGIDGSSGLGIDGSSGLGIDGSSALGIDGSSSLGIDGSSALGIDGSSLLGGPVTSISMSEGTFSAMGQDVSAPGVLLSKLRVGDFVTVDGRISGAGTIDATAVTQTGERYAAGASTVFVVGIPTSVDSKLGVATIGDLQVDYTQSIGDSEFKGIGAAIAVIGTQPALGGKMIGSKVLDKTDLFLRD